MLYVIRRAGVPVDITFTARKRERGTVTFFLELPNDLTRKLEKEAACAGLPLAEYALRILADRFIPPADEAPPRNGAELLAYWKREGLIGTRPDITDPVQHARDLRERNQRRSHD